MKVQGFTLDGLGYLPLGEDEKFELIGTAGLSWSKAEVTATVQGARFTSFDFTNVLKENGIKISMDGKGRWMDNVFIERLWRSLKYEYPFPFPIG